jgi:ubiquinol-cytochrome c reductase cytochrome b subunit
LAEKPDAALEQDIQPYRFYPEHTFRSFTVFAVLILVLVGLSIFGRIPREEIAGTILDSYLPRPEWYYMWMFQLLTYFSGPWEDIGTLAIFAIGGFLIFSVPLLGKSKAIGLARRPLCVAVGVTAIMGIVYLSIIAYADIKPYGTIIPIPARQLTAAEEHGLRVYVDRECAYCHQIQGRGGRRTGPDLSNMSAKGKNIEELARFIKNPQATSAWTIMPKYNLPETDLRSLAAFVLSLDFNRYSMKIVTREDIIKNLPMAHSQ